MTPAQRVYQEILALYDVIKKEEQENPQQQPDQIASSTEITPLVITTRSTKSA